MSHRGEWRGLLVQANRGVAAVILCAKVACGTGGLVLWAVRGQRRAWWVRVYPALGQVMHTILAAQQLASIHPSYPCLGHNVELIGAAVNPLKVPQAASTGEGDVGLGTAAPARRLVGERDGLGEHQSYGECGSKHLGHVRWWLTRVEASSCGSPPVGIQQVVALGALAAVAVALTVLIATPILRAAYAHGCGG